jgi:hypothetical protein
LLVRGGDKFPHTCEHFVPLADFNGGWQGFTEEQVNKIVWTSRTSENQLVVTKMGTGKWEVEFVPSPKSPEHRGWYWRLFEAMK